MTTKVQGTEVLTPVGKLVQGSVWELSDSIDDKTKQPKRDAQGNVIQVSYFAVAIEKNNPEWPAFFTLLSNAARAGFPQYFDAQGNCVMRDFSWKVTDGDGMDKYGKPNNAKPGFAGCWVVKFGGMFLPRCYEKGKYLQAQQLTDPRSIKPGYFVRVSAIAKPNIGSQTPGLYLNADMVELNFVGEEIVFGRDAGAAFGAQQAGYVPQGAMQLGTATPGAAMGGGGMGGGMGGPAQAMGTGTPAGLAGPGSPMGGTPAGMGGTPAGMGGTPAGMGGTPAGMGGTPAGMGGTPAGMGGTPAGMGGTPGTMATPGTAVQGNAGFVAGAMGVAMGGGIPAGMGTPQGMQPQTPQYAPTEKAAGYTLAQYLENGFNIEQLLAEGRFIRTA